ncbi:MAG: bifunctional phosphoglucose/phosphomannose isomerase [Crocinitomicaceae bacterium]|jgi:glucose/mannose-6-phosphate isomerase|tara:strand:- start:10844 stop:11827 length:984 start_codon:yes stop_codon:yes gene_type:complete
MKKLIEAFPDNIIEAMNIAESSSLQKPPHDIHNILMCGLGGSGIGAKMVANWLQDEIKVPVSLVNDYTLPGYVNKNTLIIGSSYSGNTEETTIALEEAKSRSCHIIGICSGGKLEQFCKDNGYDCIVVPGGNPPRSALAYSVIQLLHIFASLGFVSHEHKQHMLKGGAFIESHQEEIHDIAKEMAAHLFGKVGVYYAETKYEGVIVRARQQFNENSKYLGWHHVIPEMNHNELVGWTGGDDRFAPVFFNTGDLHPRNYRRFEISKSAIEKKCGKVFNVSAKGDSFIERSLYLINIVDWASYYLCEMNGADIIDIEIIDYLKSELAKF